MTSWRYVPFLIGGALFSSLCGMLSPAYLAAKKTGKLMSSTLIGSVVNIVINLAFLQLWGLQVAAVSTFVSFIVTWVIRWHLSRKIIELSINKPVFIISTVFIVLQSILLLSNIDYKFLLCLLFFIALIIINMTTIIPYICKLKEVRINRIR